MFTIKLTMYKLDENPEEQEIKSVTAKTNGDAKIAQLATINSIKAMYETLLRDDPFKGDDDFAFQTTDDADGITLYLLVDGEQYPLAKTEVIENETD